METGIPLNLPKTESLGQLGPRNAIGFPTRCQIGKRLQREIEQQMVFRLQGIPCTTARRSQNNSPPARSAGFPSAERQQRGETG